MVNNNSYFPFISLIKTWHFTMNLWTIFWTCDFFCIETKAFWTEIFLAWFTFCCHMCGWVKIRARVLKLMFIFYLFYILQRAFLMPQAAKTRYNITHDSFALLKYFSLCSKYHCAEILYPYIKLNELTYISQLHWQPF